MDQEYLKQQALKAMNIAENTNVSGIKEDKKRDGNSSYGDSDMDDPERDGIWM